MIIEHRKREKVKVEEFCDLIAKNKEKLEITDHTLFRLNEKQRKIYDANKLKDFLLNKKPIEVWKQENEHLAAFYKLESETDKIIKIILSATSNKVYIVTFYILTRQQTQELKK